MRYINRVKKRNSLRSVWLSPKRFFTAQKRDTIFADVKISLSPSSGNNAKRPWKTVRPASFFGPPRSSALWVHRAPERVVSVVRRRSAELVRPSDFKIHDFVNDLKKKSKVRTNFFNLRRMCRSVYVFFHVFKRTTSKQRRNNYFRCTRWISRVVLIWKLNFHAWIRILDCFHAPVTYYCGDQWNQIKYVVNFSLFFKPQ